MLWWSLCHVLWTFFVFPFVVSIISGWVVWIILALGSCEFDLRVYMPWIDRGVLYFRALGKDSAGLDSRAILLYSGNCTCTLSESL